MIWRSGSVQAFSNSTAAIDTFEYDLAAVTGTLWK
jgi:hypothetical protein